MKQILLVAIVVILGLCYEMMPETRGLLIIGMGLAAALSPKGSKTLHNINIGG